MIVVVVSVVVVTRTTGRATIPYDIGLIVVYACRLN